MTTIVDEKNDNCDDIIEIYDILIDFLTFSEELVKLILLYIDYYQGKLIKNWKTEMIHSTGVVTDNENIFICDEWGKIKKFNSNGECLCQTLKINDFKPAHASIYCSKIYVTDYKCKSIFIFEIQNLVFVNKFECISRCNGICVYKSKIYVSGDSVVNVYTLDGQNVNNFRINDTFLSELSIFDNKIYVCCPSINTIKIYSTDGNFLSVINKETIPGLNCPQYIFVKDEFIFINDNHTLYRCNLMGQVISELGNKMLRGFTILNDKLYCVCYEEIVHIYDSKMPILFRTKSVSYNTQKIKNLCFAFDVPF